MTPGTVLNGRAFGAASQRRRGKNDNHDRYDKSVVYHDPGSTLFVFLECDRNTMTRYFRSLTNAATASTCDLLKLCATGLMIADVSRIVGFRPRSLSQLVNLLMT